VVAQNDPVGIGYFRHVLDIAIGRGPDNKHCRAAVRGGRMTGGCVILTTPRFRSAPLGP
jgi:hypothetical protein